MAVPGSNERPRLKLAVVVGAGGMAMAIARRLGQRHRLLLADKDQDHLERKAAELHAEGFLVSTVRCDVTDADAVLALERQVEAQGGMRILVHVVGLSPSMGDWQTLMSVNLIGAALVADALVRQAGGDTAAIFISSVAAQMTPPEPDVVALLDAPLAPGFLASLKARLGDAATSSLAYQHSKFGLNRMCASRALDWGRRGARILSVSPGLIATPMGALEFERQPMKYQLLEKTPLGREGTMPEIADAVEFLSSDRASFISGIDLLVDGGLAAAMR